MGKNHIGITIHTIENHSNENILCMYIDNYFDSTYITIKHKVVVSLIDGEKEHRLTYYVALSRVTKFSTLGIKDT